MPIKTLPSADYLRACFDYNPDNGIVRWRTRPREHFNGDGAYTFFCRYRQGREITNIEKGYLNLTLDGVHYRAARVIWKMITDEEPPGIVDHADRNKLNNRWTNLREATPSQSIHNRLIRNNGVRKRYNKWDARIYYDGVSRYLGTYTTAEEAAAAYENAARKLHGEFYRDAIAKRI
jgi:hypothetical protein